MDQNSIKKSCLPIGLDYKSLRDKGMQMLQDMSNVHWTDFNEHDPGVTILEQLCYLITDISYRSMYRIEDILMKDDGSFLNDFLLPPNEVLPVSPLTIDDFRKLLLNQFESKVKNIWLENKFDTFIIYVQVRDAGSAPSAPVIQSLIQRFFYEHRNLGDVLNDVIILKPMAISLSCRFEIEESDDVEDLLADFLFNVSQYMSCEVRRELISDRLAVSSLDSLLEGPYLNNTVIPSKYLSNKTEKVTVSRIQQIASGLSKKVKLSKISLITNSLAETCYQIASDEVAELDIIASLNSIQVYQNNLLVAINIPHVQNAVLARLALCRQQEPVSTLAQVKASPPSSALNIRHYFSIQEHFPVTYGITSQKLPRSASLDRHAKAKQLKSFLLFFEQLAANSLAQIAHAPLLFSEYPPVNDNGDVISHFFQPLGNVPNIGEVLKGDFYSTPDQNTAHLQGDDMSAPALPYMNTLNHIFSRRRSPSKTEKYAAHLSARFGHHSAIPFSYLTENKIQLPSDVPEGVLKPAYQRTQLKQLITLNAFRGKAPSIHEIHNEDIDKQKQPQLRYVFSGLHRILNVMLNTQTSLFAPGNSVGIAEASKTKVPNGMPGQISPADQEAPIPLFYILDRYILSILGPLPENLSHISIEPNEVACLFSDQLASIQDFQTHLVRAVFNMSPAHLKPLIYFLSPEEFATMHFLILQVKIDPD